MLKLESLLEFFIHEAVITSGVITCFKCHNCFSSSSQGVKDWLQRQCFPVDSSIGPIAVPCNSLHIGSRQVHYSYPLRMYKGLAYCSRCGARRGCKIIKLADPCGPPPDAGAQNLRYINNDQRPQGLLRWPIDRIYARLEEADTSVLPFIKEYVKEGHDELVQHFKSHGYQYVPTLDISITRPSLA